MPAERFDIIFHGQFVKGQDPAQARIQVGRLFKASEAQLARMFSGRPVLIKQAVDLEAASRYRLAFRQAGALVEIRPSTQPPTADSNSAPNSMAKDADFSLAPANSGSLEQYAARVQPAPLPNISGIGLAPADAVPEPTRDTGPAPIDTSDLALVEGQNWSLEDCQPLPLPEVLPDISALDLAAPDDESHIPPEPPPLPLPDISQLALEQREDDNEDQSG